jgi:amino acid transporter
LLNEKSSSRLFKKNFKVEQYMANIAQPPKTSQNLKKDYLSYPEVIAQSISIIAPSTVPAAILGLIFVSAGNGTWLSFLLATIGLLFVCFNINQFARRSASPGSLYTYIVKGLGPIAGVLSGWGLLLGYMVTGMSTLCGFAIFGQMLLAQLGIHLHVLALFALCVIFSYGIAYKDIKLSAKMMLTFEGVALVFMLVLGVFIWVNKGFAIDMDQVTFQGSTPGGVITGIVLVVFAFSGFESSTSLGAEAKDPLRTIPRSLLQSTAISGAFFVFMAYVIILGFKGSGVDLGKSEAPLAFLAPQTGLGFLGALINIGALLSFFSCTLACINSTARIIFSMARHGLFHDALGEAHETNKTPHIAVALSALITFLVPAAVYLSGINTFDAQGYFGTLCSFGFLLVYILVSVAAPIYLRALGQLHKADVFYSVLGCGFMLLPLLGTIGIPGSTMFPPPAFSNNLLVWIFVAYMAVGLVWLLIQNALFPKMLPTMKISMDENDLKSRDVKNVS